MSTNQTCNDSDWSHNFWYGQRDHTTGAAFDGTVEVLALDGES